MTHFVGPDQRIMPVAGAHRLPGEQQNVSSHTGFQPRTSVDGVSMSEDNEPRRRRESFDAIADAYSHGRRRVVVRDLPRADRPVVLVWDKRRWRCPEAMCPARTWSGGSDHIGPRAVSTERARAELPRRVGPAEHSVVQAARDFGVSWHAAMAAVRDHGRPRVDHLARLSAPAAVGRDETSFLAATPQRPRLLVTGIVVGPVAADYWLSPRVS
jgi:hypothetical protein